MNKLPVIRVVIHGVIQEGQVDGGDRQKRSDVDAHDWAVGSSIHDVVRQLIDIVGLTTVATIGGVKETRAAQEWAVSREPQKPHVLRFAYQLALMLSSQADKEYAKAWFHSPNPRLDDRTPIYVLRESPLEAVQAPLLQAARSFAARKDT